MTPPPVPPDADAIDWPLLLRVFAGEGTPEESVEIDRWRAASPENAQVWEALSGNFNTSSDAPPASAPELAWGSIEERLFQGAAEVSRDRGDGALTRPSYRVFVGAICALLVVLAVVGTRGFRTLLVPEKTYTTLPGQRLAVTLVDGTQVMLAPDSRLRVPSAYASGDRDVKLEGEGYFTVIHDQRHPFIVQAGVLETQDVGTEFDVRAYADDHVVRVAVAEGEVMAFPTPHPLTPSPGRGELFQGTSPLTPFPQPMTAGDVAEMTDAGLLVTHHTNVASMTAWTQGRLVFEQTPLSQVVREVSRAYDLKVTVADSGLATYRITASFANESADDVLNDLVGIIGGRYERTGRTVVIQRATRIMQTSPSSATAPLTTVQVDRGHGN